MATAFLTGSHAYGTPRTDSDIDLVVLVSEAGMAALNELSSVKSSPGEGSAEGAVDASLRFGPLNLLCMTDLRKFEAWREGTEELIARRPVTRDEAVRVLSAKEAGACGDCRSELVSIDGGS